MYHPSRRIGSHTIRLIPTAHALKCTIRQFPTSHILNVQSGCSRSPMFSMYNQAVHDLPCSQCTIRQFPTSHVLNIQSGSSPPMFAMYNQAVPTSHVLNVQSGSSQPHMLSIYNLAASDLPCSQYTVPDLISSQGTIGSMLSYSSSQPPMFSMYNLAVPNLPASHSV